MNNDWLNDEPLTFSELQALGDAQKAMKNVSSLESIALKNTKQTFEALNQQELIKLTAADVLVLQKSALTQSNDARLFAIYLYQQLAGSNNLENLIKFEKARNSKEAKELQQLFSNLRNIYENMLHKITVEDNDVGAAFLYGKSKMGNDNPQEKSKGVEVMNMLIASPGKYPQYENAQYEAALNELSDKAKTPKTLLGKAVTKIGLVKDTVILQSIESTVKIRSDISGDIYHAMAKIDPVTRGGIEDLDTSINNLKLEQIKRKAK